MALTDAQIQAMQTALKGMGTNLGTTPAPPSSVATLPPPTNTVPVPASNTPTPQMKPLNGPTVSGQPLPSVPVPTNSPVPIQKTATPLNGTMQGPYPTKDASGNTSIQQGMKVVNGVMTPAPPQAKVLTPAEIAAQRIAEQRAALAGSVKAYDAQRKAAYDYAQQTTRSNRAMLQFDNSNRGDQFGGSAREDLFRLQRSQSLEDTAANTNYQNDIAASDAKLAAFDANSAGQQQDIENQLQQQQFQNNLATNQDNRAAQNQNFNQGITQAGLTGVYNPTGMSADQVQAKMDANSKAYATASPTQQQSLHDENLQLAQLLGKNYDSGSGTYSAGQGFVGTKTLQAQQFAYQQSRDAIKDKQYQQQFDMDTQKFGLDYALKQATLANQITNDQAQRAIGWANEQNSAANSAASIDNMKADNARADNAVKLSADGRAAQGTILGDLSKLTANPTTAEANIKKYFDANADHFGSIVGADAYDKMKQQALAPYQKVTQADKQDQSVKDRAIAAAQKDFRWDAKGTDKAALIKEYEAYYQ